MFRFLRIFLIGVSFCIMSIPGAYAIWTYYTPMTPVDARTEVNMGEWDPAYVLPEEEGGIEGTDHTTMINEIVDNKHAGLNPKPQVLLGAIKDTKKNPFASQGLFYSEQEKVTGGNLKFLFQSSIENVDFLMQTIVDGQSYYVYTYLHPTESQNGLRITVYRTLVEKINGKWAATSAAQGSAPVVNVSGRELYFSSIDYTKWVNT